MDGQRHLTPSLKIFLQSALKFTTLKLTSTALLAKKRLRRYLKPRLCLYLMPAKRLIESTMINRLPSSLSAVHSSVSSLSCLIATVN